MLPYITLFILHSLFRGFPISSIIIIVVGTLLSLLFFLHQQGCVGAWLVDIIYILSYVLYGVCVSELMYSLKGVPIPWCCSDSFILVLVLASWCQVTTADYSGVIVVVILYVSVGIFIHSKGYPIPRCCSDSSSWSLFWPAGVRSPPLTTQYSYIMCFMSPTTGGSKSSGTVRVRVNGSSQLLSITCVFHFLLTNSRVHQEAGDFKSLCQTPVQ